jgi:hypothetical protein
VPHYITAHPKSHFFLFFFLYLCNDAFSRPVYLMLMIWYILMYYVDSCFEELRKAMKNLGQNSRNDNHSISLYAFLSRVKCMDLFHERK